MGYHYRPSGMSGIDVLTVTKKGEEKGGLLKGAILPIGYLHVPGYYKAFQQLVKDAQAEVYVAKHCEDEDEVMYLTDGGIVNRFGLFLTKDKCMAGKTNWSLDIAGGMGWVKRVTVKDVSEIAKYL